MGNKKRKKMVNYHIKGRLTVGVLEEICRKIQDKRAIVLISDKQALNPQFGVRAVPVKAVNSKEVIGLNILGKFSWGAENDDIDDDDDDEDVPFKSGDTCGVIIEAEYSKVDETPPRGTEYLGEIGENRADDRSTSK